MIVLTNTTPNEIIVMERLFRESGENDDSYEIPVLRIPEWANSSAILSYIADGSLSLSLNQTVISDVNRAINTLKGIGPKQVENLPQAFAAKTLPNGKKLFRRVIGMSTSVNDSEVTVNHTVTYANCKITGVEVIGAVLGDSCKFQVRDTAAGTLTTVPFFLLNEFGTGVFMAKDFHDFYSEYDADLFVGLVVRMLYTPKDTGAARDVYFNLILHEVV